MATTLSRAEREARVRHPTHVRTGFILYQGDMPRTPFSYTSGLGTRREIRRLPGSSRAGCRSSRP